MGDVHFDWKVGLEREHKNVSNELDNVFCFHNRNWTMLQFIFSVCAAENPGATVKAWKATGWVDILINDQLHQ